MWKHHFSHLAYQINKWTNRNICIFIFKHRMHNRSRGKWLLSQGNSVFIEHIPLLDTGHTNESDTATALIRPMEPWKAESLKLPIPPYPKSICVIWTGRSLQKRSLSTDFYSELKGYFTEAGILEFSFERRVESEEREGDSEEGNGLKNKSVSRGKKKFKVCMKPRRHVVFLGC